MNPAPESRGWMNRDETLPQCSVGVYPCKNYAHKGLHYAHSLYHKEGPDEIGTNKEERVSDVPINESERVTE